MNVLIRYIFLCIAGLQINLYAMDVRAYGVYRFGIIDKVFLPASTQELSAYESVHVMLRSLEVCISFFFKKGSITLFYFPI
jgi:hypothetical protein